jgi:hypothetical protein
LGIFVFRWENLTVDAQAAGDGRADVWRDAAAVPVRDAGAATRQRIAATRFGKAARTNAAPAVVGAPTALDQVAFSATAQADAATGGSTGFAMRGLALVLLASRLVHVLSKDDLLSHFLTLIKKKI